MMWGNPKVIFSCNQEDYGAVAEPVQAAKVLPDWYRRLPTVDPNEVTTQETGKTVKTCMPFFDAMAMGWVLRAPVEFTVDVTNEGHDINAGWRYTRPILEMHKSFQIRGHPREGNLILRMFMFWSVRTPAGYSSLVTQPFNRTDLPFEAITGIIDTDRAHGVLHLPMFCNLPDGLHTISKGTPIAQVIPFRRESFDVQLREETRAETESVMKQIRLLASESGGYRKHMRAKRK